MVVRVPGADFRPFPCAIHPAAAGAIHENDTPKLIRAIEVCMQARRPMSAMWQEQGRSPLTGFRILRIGLNPDRAALYGRINQRVLAMIKAGLIDETRGLSLEMAGKEEEFTSSDQ